ncbi:putative alpha-l-rhamnosidase protein [Botryosphaeria dothidea]|uniref:Alpha-l-rhamnosidase protein n=1 Tax=Botryosphaeria dothidea TaxID=55169 RepID=A0A8H4IX53_9PEZI|nr:putative alpha-l-rhamnosidase protein [Botryosphaeria dothidea]
MKDDVKLKLILWLSGVQFLLSSLVLGMNTPARVFVRLHNGPDVLVDGKYTQHRKYNDSPFVLHLWSIEIACSSGICGILLFVVLLGFVCRYGWDRVARKIRNPYGSNGVNNPLTILTTHFMYVSSLISGSFEIQRLLWGINPMLVFLEDGLLPSARHYQRLPLDQPADKPLGSFSIETYICEILEYSVSTTSRTDQAAIMLYAERCTLARAARWVTLLSALFFFCVWVLDTVTRPVHPYAVARSEACPMSNASLSGFEAAITLPPQISRRISGVWDDNIYAPSSRTVQPKSILSLANASEISSYPGPATLAGNASALVFDFGLEVGGIIHLSYSTSGSGTGTLGLAFSEAKNWIGLYSDSSNGLFQRGDGAIYDAPFAGAGIHSYVVPDEKLRGGFRYLTVLLLTNSTSSGPSINPTWSNLRAYNGYFHCNDEELNRIWYAGAYTLQTNAVPVNTGRAWPALSYGWANNGSLANGSTVIVDGAKRDRAVWPGDMGVAVPAAFVSTGDLESVKNALEVMYDYQEADGAIPEAGPPLLQKGSDTYHMWTMIGTYNYVLYSGDLDFLEVVWERYLKAMDYVYGKVDDSGLLNVTGIRDWARWQQGWNNTEANMILYHTLVTGATLADWQSNTTNSSLSTAYLSRAASLRTAIKHPTRGILPFSSTGQRYLTPLHPQDANSLSLYLRPGRPSAPKPPSSPGNISPFISSLELHGHLAAHQPQLALDLIRRSWGWYASHPNGTGSTVIEGYLTNGSFSYRSSRGYGYDASYVSHAHGWSAGPTSALTEGIVG